VQNPCENMSIETEYGVGAAVSISLSASLTLFLLSKEAVMGPSG
jgi:hypothetical protein